MARGYSASRTKSARPTLKTKRRRSLSLQKLEESVKNPQSTPATQGSAPASRSSSSRRIPAVLLAKIKGASKKTESAAPEEETTPHVTAQSRARSAAAANKERPQSLNRKRSQSTLKHRIEQMEFDLNAAEVSENEDETVARSDVITKYKSAGRAVDEVLDEVAAACVAGANTKALCELGDKQLHQKVVKMFSKAKDKRNQRIARGLSFPTNVSVNHVLCNHTPASEAEGVVLKSGDIVKIHLGCHIDGYPVSAARTITVSGGSEAATEASARVVDAARVAMLGMIRMLRPGALNADITDFIQRVGHAYGVEAIEGVLSNRTKRWVPDGMDSIITRRVTREDPHQDVADCTIGENQVWTLDVAFTNSPSYRCGPADEQCNIFRKNEVEAARDPRVRAAYAALDAINGEFYCFPFNVNHLENPMRMRMGIAMLKQMTMIDEYFPMQTKKGISSAGTPSINARFSATVAGSHRRVTVLCGEPAFQSFGADLAAEDVEIAGVLAQPLDFVSTGKSASASAAAAAAETTTEEKDESASAPVRRKVKPVSSTPHDEVTQKIVPRHSASQTAALLPPASKKRRTEKGSGRSSSTMNDANEA